MGLRPRRSTPAPRRQLAAIEEQANKGRVFN
jgi:hypothetical protein